MFKKKKESKFSKKFRKATSFLEEKVTSLTNVDWIIIGIFVVFYSIISFNNLGTLQNPQTYYRFTSTGEEVGVELVSDSQEVSMIRHYAGDDEGTYNLFISDDGNSFVQIDKVLEQKSVFAWNDTYISKKFKYLKIVANQDGGSLGDIQLYDAYGNKLETRASDDQSNVIVDELDTVPARISYLNSSYFDEIYFARTAYEYAHGITVEEWTHPPLGKLIQMIPILLFGMSTFAYRFMGNVAGILMIPTIYVFAKDMFKKRKWAVLAAVLMTFDCFHFAQTRMGTVDSFLVLFIMLSSLFMYRYVCLDDSASIRKKLTNLGLSGLFIGCSIATKWTGFYAGLALCIAFFTHFIVSNIKGRRNHKKVRFEKDDLTVILSCVLFFVIVPVVIYVLCYLLFPNMYPYHIDGIGDIFKQTGEMFKYHSTLDATHDFASPWYTWPIMKRPVWYYVGYFNGDLKGTITGIGNPAIWWFGILGAIYCLVDAIKNRRKETLYIVLFIACTWLPYVFIGRIMFMYHYFPVLPFIMLANVALIKWLTDLIDDNSIYYFYIGVVILFFIYFFPIISGTVKTAEFIDKFKWFKSWFF